MAITVSKKIREYSLFIRLIIVSLVIVIFLGIYNFRKIKENDITYSHDVAINVNRKLMFYESSYPNMKWDQYSEPIFYYIRDSVQRLITVSNVFHNEKPKLNCTPSAIYEFPPDGLTRDQRKMGWIVLHLIVSIYCFWLLSTVCEEYFIPAIEEMCESKIFIY